MKHLFAEGYDKPKTTPGQFDPVEVGLANRNHGGLLETLACDVTPTGAHYLLNHFDIPLIDPADHALEFLGAFAAPMTLSMDQIQAMPQVTRPVTLECAGNGRAGMTPRAYSMPWAYEAVGTSEWTGTPLAPIIAEAAPQDGVVEFSFTGADYGYDAGVPHHYGRSLTVDQLAELDVLLVYAMNGQPLLPQHGAPLRIVVPGWYGMASVKWLNRIEALTQAYDGFQQMRTYRYRQVPEEQGDPVNQMRVKSLMVAPGVPDWLTRTRYLQAGPAEVIGRAWSGAGVPIAKVEVGVGNTWAEAEVLGRADTYAWTKWVFKWIATPGEHQLRCRATDADGHVQPLEAPFDLGGFANNAAQVVNVVVE